MVTVNGPETLLQARAAVGQARFGCRAGNETERWLNQKTTQPSTVVFTETSLV